MKKLLGISIKKRLYFTSSYTQCFWKILSNKTFDIKFYKMNKDMNILFLEKNKKLFNNYFQKNLITKKQYEALYSNNNKVYTTLTHPLIYIKVYDNIYFIAETLHMGTFKRILNDKEIQECNITTFQKADKILIEEFEGKFYAFAFWKLGNEDKIKVYSLEERVAMNSEQLERFKIFLNFNIHKFNIYNLDWYIETSPLLESLVDYNIKNNIIKINGIEKIKPKEEL